VKARVIKSQAHKRRKWGGKQIPVSRHPESLTGNAHTFFNA
jgi:hypothetical protein